MKLNPTQNPEQLKGCCLLFDVWIILVVVCIFLFCLSLFFSASKQIICALSLRPWIFFFLFCLFLFVVFLFFSFFSPFFFVKGDDFRADKDGYLRERDGEI